MTTHHEILLTVYTQDTERMYKLFSTVNGLTLYFEAFEHCEDFAAIGSGNKLSLWFNTEEETQKYIQLLTADERTISIEKC